MELHYRLSVFTERLVKSVLIIIPMALLAVAVAVVVAS